MHPLACLVQKILIESLPAVRIEDAVGSEAIFRITLKGPVSTDYQEDLERRTKAAMKEEDLPELVEMESSGARERFKALNQPFFARLCQRGPLTPALRIKDFYIPLEEEVEISFPKYFSLLSIGPYLFICSGESRQEVVARKKIATSWNELSHLEIGKKLVRCIGSSACFTPSGARVKGWLKSQLFNAALSMGFEPISVRSLKSVWEFLESLRRETYFQLEVFSNPLARGEDLFSLQIEGALSIRERGSKDHLNETLNSSLQLIHKILKIGDIADMTPLEREGSEGKLEVYSGLCQRVTLAQWEISNGKFELFFFIDRWIGVLIELGKHSTVSWLMKEGCCFEN